MARRRARRHADDAKVDVEVDEENKIIKKSCYLML